MAASCYSMVFLSLVLFVVAVTADHTHHDHYISPALAPYVDDICNDIDCGKGSCVVDLSYQFNFRCECDAGWKRTRLNNESHFQFLPCIIPNCSLDYSCMSNTSHAPAPAPASAHNASAYDPCDWIYCGEGTCKTNKPYGHLCECNSGSYNILNISFYPCYSDCALGSDCEKLGVVKSSNATISSSPPNAGTRALPFLAGNFMWLCIFMVSIPIILWK